MVSLILSSLLGTVPSLDTHFTSFNTRSNPRRAVPSADIASAHSPKIRILCAKEIVNNRCVAFSSIVMSEKLLRDHSEYFAALARGPWREARSCVLRLPEIRIEDFKRLELTLVAGGAASRNNIGKPTAVITNLVETYLLADYFAMPVVQAWLKASLDDYFVEHRAWSALYVNQILDPAASARTPSAEQMHKDKVLDFCTAFDRLQQLAPEQQIISIDNLIRYLCSHCPRPLMSSVVESLGLELIRLCFSAYLLI